MRKYIALTGIFALLFCGAGQAVAALTTTGLTLEDAGNGVINVIAADTTDLYGVAFTIVYDSALLNDPEIESDYFPTFTAMSGDTVNYPGITDVTSVEGYASPVVTNTVSISGAGYDKGVRIAAADAISHPGSNVTIFTLTFTAKEENAGAAVSLIQTSITNPDAGYPTETAIDPLIGYDTAEDSYGPILAGSLPTLNGFSPPAGSTFNLDVDGDGYAVATDGALLYYYFINRNDLIEQVKSGPKTLSEIQDYIAGGLSMLDVDDDGFTVATDAALIYYDFINRPDLIELVKSGPRSLSEIKAYIGTLMP